MKFSSIVKQCINFRNSLLEDGYHVDIFKADTLRCCKHWVLKHPNGHMRFITLDCYELTWYVTNECGKTLIKLAADA